MRAGLVSSLVAATFLATPALAQPGNANVPPTPAEVRREPSVELNARLGLKFPGEISPHNWFSTDTAAAPLLGVDASWVVARHFSLGSYVLFSPFSFDRTSGSETIGEGSGSYVGLGVALKGRWPASPQLLLRGGLTLGANFVSYDGESKDTPLDYEFEATGSGLQVGAVVDVVYRFKPQLGVVAQLGFFSQPLGSATVKGYPTSSTGSEDRDFSFTPIPMLTAGVELGL